MDRRGFLRMMVGGVATAAAVRTFPFRVFSFPREIQFANPFLTADQVRAMEAMEAMVPLSLELVQDGAFDMEKFLAAELARRVEICRIFRVPPHIVGLSLDETRWPEKSGR